MSDPNGMQSDKPSQAEGEDPDRLPQGDIQPDDGHPSQAEGEDVAPGESQSPTTE
jgi:hypothetical protein